MIIVLGGITRSGTASPLAIGCLFLNLCAVLVTLRFILRLLARICMPTLTAPLTFTVSVIYGRVLLMITVVGRVIRLEGELRTSCAVGFFLIGTLLKE